MRWLIKADTCSALGEGKAENGEGLSPPITCKTALSNAHFQSRPLDTSLEIIRREVKCPDCRQWAFSLPSLPEFLFFYTEKKWRSKVTINSTFVYLLHSSLGCDLEKKYLNLFKANKLFKILRSMEDINIVCYLNESSHLL